MKSQLEKKAIKFCIENKLRLTEPRLLVLKIISASKKPIKAYEILKELGKKLKTRSHQQPTEQLNFGVNLILSIGLKA